ncbi:PNPase/RNase_PH domain superfamily [Hexamita inflata]|uniref:PNPase/RNase PH domain superfamily n=1 Tax=Hexamita inflata TaxID=28002 RepID=A0AA86NM88_9EUKA|nr:PNPase/RNase PH domain superfamily [Hexamita inflata]
MSELRVDGRSFSDFRRPVLKFGIIPGVPSLQYQVNSNLLLVSIKPASKFRIVCVPSASAQTFFYQIKSSQQMLTSMFSKLISNQLEFRINILASDRTLQTHLFNACMILLVQSGFQLEAVPFAMSAYVKNENILIDDERMNAMFITDENDCYYSQGSGIGCQQINEVYGVVKEAVKGYTEYVMEIGK